jgi:hypothetical protein
MNISGKVHCFFEQSGTFKKEFIKLGIPAEDYDIQDKFGETNHIVDIFDEIEKAFRDKPCLFDAIDTTADLIIAFFPCIEFSNMAQMWYSLGEHVYAKWPYKKRIAYMVHKNRERARLYEIMIKFSGVCLDRGIRMIMENPWKEQSYLRSNIILKPPTIIDFDRTRRGDYVKKPTAYWFWNCEPTYGNTLQQTPKNRQRRIIDMKRAPHAGICSTERSMISSEYASNFICDFILGKAHKYSELTLFDQ